MIRRQDTPRMEAWKLAHDAAKAQGAPDPRACADRYVQGLERTGQLDRQS